jgi:hypothetical protein
LIYQCIFIQMIKIEDTIGNLYNKPVLRTFRTFYNSGRGQSLS